MVSADSSEEKRASQAVTEGYRVGEEAAESGSNTDDSHKPRFVETNMTVIRGLNTMQNLDLLL